MKPMNTASDISAQIESIRGQAAALATHPERVLDLYRNDPETRGGAYVSGDELVRVLPFTASDPLVSYAFAWEHFSALPPRLFRDRMALPAVPGERVLFTMGMPATGKTTLVKSGFGERFHTVVDSPLGDFQTARDWQGLVRASGRGVSFVLAWRPYGTAVKGMLERALPVREGRAVSLVDLANLTLKTLDAFLRLAEMNRYDEDTTLDLVEVVDGRRVWRPGTEAASRAAAIREAHRSDPAGSLLLRMAGHWREALRFAEDLGWDVPDLLRGQVEDGTPEEMPRSAPAPRELATLADVYHASSLVNSLRDHPEFDDEVEVILAQADAWEEGLRGWRVSKEGV